MTGELTLSGGVPAGVPPAVAADPRFVAAVPLLARGWALFVLGENKRPLLNCGDCPEHNALERDGVTRHDATVCEHLTCHGFYAATCDPVRLAAMLSFAPAGLLAVRTGKTSRIAVVDAEGSADDKSGLTGIDVVERWHQWFGFDLPATLMARTPSGGLHLFYALPPDLTVRSPQRVAPKVDLKAEGGYVAIPPSEGRGWVNDAEPVLADGAVLGWMLGARGSRVESSGQNGHGEFSADDYDYAAYVRDGCPAGVRDHFANDLAFRYRKGGIPRAYAEQSARVMWQRMEQPPGDEYTWQKMLAKLDHVYDTVEPEQIGGTASYGPGNAEVTVEEAVQAAHGRTPFDLGAELTQTGIALRYAERFHGRFLYVPGLGWHRWDEACWAYDELNESFRVTQQVLLDLHNEAGQDDPGNAPKWATFIRNSASMGGRAAMLTGASAEPGMKASVRMLNADPYLLVVRNGTVDLRTGELRASAPGDHNTHCAEVVFDPHAECSKWREHVSLVSCLPDGTPDPGMEAYLQRWAGYTLTGLVSEQRFFFGFGEGSNGKNVLIETLVGMLGSYAKRGSTKIILGGTQEHETVIADLAGARMIFIDETPQGKVNEARLKELTGNARISARKIAKDPFEFEATFKIWMAGNNRPRVTDTSEGFWRRMDLVPFDATIPAERRVKDYTRVLVDERPGILNWALEGLRAYLEQGLIPPDRVRIAGQDYRDEENIFGQFVADCFAVGQPLVWHPNNVLQSVYLAWCAENGVDHRLSPRGLATEWLRNRFQRDAVVNRRIVQGWPDRKSRTQRGWFGPPLTVACEPRLQWNFPG